MSTNQILYNALNGLEIRTIVAKKLEEIRDKLLNLSQLKEGLCFHKAIIEVAWRLRAYPADVPVPEDKVFEYHFVHQDFKESEFLAALESVKKIEDYRAYVQQEMIRIKEELDLGEQILQTLSLEQKKLEVKVEGLEVIKDDGQPDKIRLENDIPIKEVQRVGSQMAEVPKPFTLNTGTIVNK